MTRVIDSMAHVGEEAEAPFDGNREVARLATLVAQLVLLIEDTQGLGNASAEYSLTVQLHQAMADMLAALVSLDTASAETLQALRARHIARANHQEEG